MQFFHLFNFAISWYHICGASNPANILTLNHEKDIDHSMHCGHGRKTFRRRGGGDSLRKNGNSLERTRGSVVRRRERHVHHTRRTGPRAPRRRRGGRDERQAWRGVHGDRRGGQRRLRTRRAHHLHGARRHGRRALGLPRRRLPAPAQQGRMGADLHLHPL